MHIQSWWHVFNKYVYTNRKIKAAAMVAFLMGGRL